LTVRKGGDGVPIQKTDVCIVNGHSLSSTKKIKNLKKRDLNILLKIPKSHNLNECTIIGKYGGKHVL